MLNTVQKPSGMPSATSAPTPTASLATPGTPAPTPTASAPTPTKSATTPGTPAPTPTTPARGRGGGGRLAPQERRRQLVGIGLRKFVERPVQELSLDEVAAEAGVSRGLLFHYFPTKTAYHRAVVEAAGRRVLRNLRPDDGAVGEAALDQLVRRFLAQVARRRDSYLALVYGQVGALHEGGGTASAERAVSLRERIAELAMSATDLPAPALGAAHAWVAYVEDRALQWSARDEAARALTLEAEVAHCIAALHALAALPSP